MAAYLKKPFTYNPLIARKPLIRVTYVNSILAMTYSRGQQVAKGRALRRKAPGGLPGEGFHEQ
jgi:hypothetical protein